MPLAKLDLEIDQGFLWEALLVFPGNRWRSAQFKGQIRRKPKGDEVLAFFKFDFPQYNEPKDQTEVRMFIPKLHTANLPATGANLWSYDVIGQLVTNQSIVVLAGRVQVFEIVTEDT